MKTTLLQADELTRRGFISGAARTFLGVGLLPAALQTRALAAGAGASRLRQVPTARNVIYLYMNGGMSHLDTFDPKPGSEVMGPTKAIKSNVDGILLSAHLPRMAREMDKVAVINSMISTQGAHKQGYYYMHTSYALRGTIRHPSMGAWLARFQEKGNDTLPASVMIGSDSQHPGAGFFESRFSPLAIKDPKGGLQNSRRLSHLSDQRFETQLDLIDRLDRKFVETYDQKNVRAYTDMYDDAVSMMSSRDLAAFDLKEEPAEMRERYGDNSFGQGCLLARRLVERNVRFVEVTYGNWDTHNGNFLRVPDLAETLDTALSALLSDLARRGLLEETLVVLTTEFGRTPEINQNEGRDHHPQAFTALLAGGGIVGGQAYGKSDEKGSLVAEDKVTIPDFNATIGYALGLPLDAVIYSPSKRPFTVADKGQPITRLFGHAPLTMPELTSTS